MHKPIIAVLALCVAGALLPPLEAQTQNNQVTPLATAPRMSGIAGEIQGLSASLKEAAAQRSTSTRRGVASNTEADASLLATAKERKALLIRLAGQDVSKVPALLFSKEERKLFPKAVQDEMEKDISLPGTIYTPYADTFGQQARARAPHYFAARGAIYEFYPLHSLENASRISATVSGVAIGDAAIGTASRRRVVRGSVSPSDTTGAQKTAVILIDPEGTGARPFSADAARNLVFGGPVPQFMKEQSSGRTSLEGDIFGWFTVPAAWPYPEACYALSVTDLEQLAARENIPLQRYGRIVILVNHTSDSSGCSSVGKWQLQQGNARYNASVSWVGLAGYDEMYKTTPESNWTIFDFALAHELGHALGLEHSQGWDCGAVTFGEGCREVNYGDHFDIMGMLGRGLSINGIERQILGWLPEANVQTITKPGEYRLQAPQTSSGAPQGKSLARISLTGLKNPIFLELRSDNQSNSEGLFVRYSMTDGGRKFSRLLDAQPTSTYWEEDTASVTIDPGATLLEPVSGVKISDVRIEGAGKSRQIVFRVNDRRGGGGTISRGAQCVRNFPVISEQVADAWATSSGIQVSFRAVFTNTDSSPCGSSLFSSNLTGTGLATGKDSSLKTITVAPARSGSFSMQFTIPNGQRGKTYPFEYEVVNRNSGKQTVNKFLIEARAN